MRPWLTDAMALVLGVSLSAAVCARNVYDFKFSEGFKFNSLAAGAWVLLTLLLLQWLSAAEVPPWKSYFQSLTLGLYSALLAWSAVCSLFSVNLTFSLWGSPDRFQGFLHEAIYLIWIWVLWNTLRQTGVRKSLYLHVPLLFTLGFQALYAIAQAVGIDVANSSLEGINRVMTTMGVHNYLNSWLWLGLFYGLYVQQQFKQKLLRQICLAWVPLISVALVFSFSKAAWMGALLALGIGISWLSLPQLQARGKSLLFIFQSVFSAFALLIYFGPAWFRIGVCILVALGLAAFAYRYITDRRELLLYFLSLLLTLYFPFSTKRMLWYLVVLALAAATTWLASKLKSRLRPICNLLLLMLIGIGVAQLIYFGQAELQEEIKSKTMAHQAYVRVVRSQSRYWIWKSVPPWVRDHPLLGTGPETVGLVYPHYRVKAQLRFHGENVDRMHNYVLDLLVTRGIPGVLIYVVGFGFLFWRVLQKLASEPPLKSLSLVLAVVAYQVQLFFAFDFVSGIAWFLFVLVLLEVELSHEVD